MKKRTWAIFGVVFLLGGFLYFFGSMQDNAPPPLAILESRLPQKTRPNRDTRSPEEVQRERLQESESLAEVREITISVVAADIRLKSGESWAIDYKLAEGETLEIYEIRGKTDLIFKSKSNWGVGVGVGGGGYVEITVPTGLYLRDIEINTVSGDIIIENLGDVEELSLNSVSGDCKATGTVADSVDVETVSGDIIIESAASYEIEATSVSGDMDINGEKPKFRYESNRDGLPEIDATSVSGDIKIKTEQDR